MIINLAIKSIFAILTMAQFFIQTDKPAYFAGQMVNGQIYINIGAFITGAQGVSLRFTGYECVKWVQATQLKRTKKGGTNKKGTKRRVHDPIAAIPKGQLFHSKTNVIEVSDCQSQEDRSYDHRPKYIKTPQNKYFRMQYFQTRNMFVKNKMMIYQCNGFAPGQYSFPFCFKTFQGWPASFQHNTQRKKGVIVYHMTVAIQPVTKQFQMKFRRQITLRQTRVVTSKMLKSQAEITSCCCLNKGITATQIHFEKDGYVPGELVQMIMEIDNSNCTADITTISINIQNQVLLRSGGSSTADNYPVINKQINGVPAGQKLTENSAIREAFNLSSNRQIKPTCSGKLLSNSYTMSVMMNHDISCDCCSSKVGVSIPIIIFPIIPVYAMPPVFQTNWAPQNMPIANMALENNFNNFQLSQMQEQQFPPTGYPPVYPNNPNGPNGGTNAQLNATEQAYRDDDDGDDNDDDDGDDQGQQMNETNMNMNN